jgi:hypothetical protein
MEIKRLQASALTLLICIQEVSSSNLGRNTDGSSSWFLSVTSANRMVIIFSFHIISNSMESG